MSGVAATASSPRFLYQSGITTSATSPYTWDQAKWQAEEAVKQSGADWTIVRCCWAFGRNDTALNRIIGYSDYLPFVPIFGNGQEPLTPVFVEDIGRLYALLVDNPDRARNTIYGLGGPDLVTLDQFLHLALRAMGRARPILHIPKPIGKVQGAVMYRLPGKPLSPAAVDFVAADGAVTEADRRLLAERFPEFRATPVQGRAGELPEAKNLACNLVCRGGAIACECIPAAPGAATIPSLRRVGRCEGRRRLRLPLPESAISLQGPVLVRRRVRNRADRVGRLPTHGWWMYPDFVTPPPRRSR